MTQRSVIDNGDTRVVTVNAASADETVTLRKAERTVVKRTDTSGHTVTIRPFPGKTLDGTKDGTTTIPAASGPSTPAVRTFVRFEGGWTSTDNASYFSELFLDESNNLTDAVSASAARTALGLGSSATQTPAQLAANAAFTGTYVRAVILPVASGGDDAAAINAVLAANPNAYIKGVEGQTYKAGSAFILRTGQTLDVTGCTITTMTTTPAGPVLTNAAFQTTARGAVDVVATSGSAVITSATAAFTSADVGAAVRLYSGTAAGTALDTTISAVNSATQATLAANVTNSLTAGYMSIGPRDTNITVIGGTWIKGSQSTNPDDYRRNLIHLRRVDGLVMRDMKLQSTIGKFAIALADVTKVKVRDIDFATYSDGCHIDGPAQYVVVEALTGTTGDNVVALLNQNAPEHHDTHGAISDVLVSDVYATWGSGPNIAINCRNVDGAKTDRINIRNCHATSLLSINTSDTTTSGIAGAINVSDCSGTVRVYNGTSIVIDALRIARHALRGVLANNTHLVNVMSASGADIKQLIIRDVKYEPITGTGCSLFNLDGTSIVRNLEIDGFDVLGPSPVVCQVSSASSTLTSAHIKNGRFEATSSGSIVSIQPTTTTLGTIVMRDIHIVSTANICSVKSPCTIVSSGISGAATGGFGTGNNCAITLRLSGIQIPSYSDFVGSGGTTRSIAPELRVDVSKLAKNAGDLAYNTNAALSVGVGPVMCDGTDWKRVDQTGLVKTGTAVLVGGTVTVSDAAITAASEIRLRCATLGGTPGALYVSAKSAGVSFTITSTSGTDTSTVAYDVVKY